MDATQQIEDSFFGEQDDSDQEDKPTEENKKEPLAVLRVFKNNHIPETEVPLYQGENVLGRDPISCSMPLQARSISGHHAIISITVFGPNDHRANNEVTETLLWDLGSLNGTRKGRFKLTPHVRYALNDGDGIVLADLPCQYVSLKTTEKNTHMSTDEKDRGQMSSSSSADGDTVKGVESDKKSTVPPVPVWSDEAKKSPQELQIILKQPEMTLVPESDSDSDGEKHGQRERRRIVDSTSSDFSSPTCSTFLTSATKIIPESEDESSITPSSTLKGRFQKVENDPDVSPGPSKLDPLHFNVDSDTDVEEDDAKMLKATSENVAVTPSEPIAVNPAGLHMDSDTDAEEEEIRKVKSDPESTELESAKLDLVNPAAQNMDSDTDVEEDEPVKPDTGSSAGLAILEEKIDAVSTAQIHLESDTDVEDEEEGTGIQDIRSRPVDEFNMNSDTDVEEEETTEAPVQPCEMGKHVPDAKMLLPESDSDTDVEDDVTRIRTPTVAKETGNSETAGERSTSTLPDRPIRAQSSGEASQDKFRLDSDTDVEEAEDKMEEKEQKYKEAAMQIFHSSTPRGAGLPEEEIETQAFLSPSHLFKRPGLPSYLRSSVSPGGISNADEDFAVAETQSFMCDPAQAEATLDETPQSINEPQRSGGVLSFQLDLSDSTNQMTEAEEHNRRSAEEDWQLQATQLYESNPKPGSTPLDLDATQAFTNSISRKKEDEEDGRQKEEDEETLPQSHLSIDIETQIIKPRAQNKISSEFNVNIGAGEQESKDEDVYHEMQADSHLSTADTLLIIRSPRQEEQTQPYAFLAENIQEDARGEEHGNRDQEVEQGGKGQRSQNGMTGHERWIKEHEPTVIDDKNDVTGNESEDEKKENKKKESANEIDEARTQPAGDDAIIETQPRHEEKDEEEHEEKQLNEPSSSKETWSMQGESAQPDNIEHHTRAAIAIAETLPMCDIEEEQDEEKNEMKENQRPGRRRPSAQVEPKDCVESDKFTNVTIAEMLPLCEEDNEGQQEQSEFVSKRTAKRRQNIKACHVTIPETQPICDAEEEEPQIEPRKSQRGKQTAKVEATQPLDMDFTDATLKMVEKKDETTGTRGLKRKEACGKGRGRGRVAAKKDEKGKAEQDENCEEDINGENKGRKRKNPRLTYKNDDKARLGYGAENEKLVREDEEESKSQQDTGELLEKEKSLSLEKKRNEREEERREQEEQARTERERTDQEKKAREEKEQHEIEMKGRFEREKQMEKERREQERIARESKEKEEEKLEKEKQDEKDRLAKEKEKQEREMEQKRKKIKGNKDCEEKELRQASGRRKSVREAGEIKKEETKQRQEQELTEEQKKEYEGSGKQQEKQEQVETDMKPKRGRRTARQSIAPTACAEDEGGPAKRTRSRSNSSNSVCSEQSAQDSINEGRRRGRRTSTVIPCETDVSKLSAHSRSERSSDSVATLGRGRGMRRTKSVQVEEAEEEKQEKTKRSGALGRGRGRGRGGKRPGRDEIDAAAAGEAEAKEAEFSPVDAENSVISQSSSRGRKRGANISRAETPQPIPKTPRRSIAGPTHKVLFTGVADEDGEKLVVRLGGALAKGVSDMTHLVTDKVRRTVKFLCAVARGVPIVTPDWLSKCGNAGSFLSPNGFLVKDVEQEKKFNFSLQDALRVASSQPLLQGYEIHVTPSVKPEPIQMKEIITCCGARFLPKMPSAYKAQVLVVSCEEDRALCERAQSLSFHVVSAEFLLTGILQQKVDVQTHALFLSPTVSGSKTNTRRRGK